MMDFKHPKKDEVRTLGDTVMGLKMMKCEKQKILLVTGSREIDDIDFVFECLDKIKQIFDFDTIIEGGAGGVDSYAGLYGMNRGLKNITKYADWRKYGKAAGPIRNKKMVKMCDKGIAIWDGKSKGTKHCISELKKANKLLKVFRYDKNG